MVMWLQAHASLSDETAQTQRFALLQAKVTASTVALRAALIKQKNQQQAALDSLAVLPGCNRTADMQYAVAVSVCTAHAVGLENTTCKFSCTTCIRLAMYLSAAPVALLRHQHNPY